ncbi:DNA polymerase subunit gamma-2, mitochondrial isoform X2 [Gadus chalcogrammus]|uniref:DNA polymerase subunit gamma-2, mitochondrial isoform X2 n=1 Tax=Gadus chalcogrammus TaxID=1042646 RepID=UPI0024C35295|nr:DNA polymerase subunit gamma-2, mitochondrial isoform X2 [Gadus chalcogrammus]
MISHCMKRFRICCETRSIRVPCRDFVGQYIANRYKTTVCPNDESDPTRMLLELCVNGFYVAPGQVHTDLFQRGMCCNYGPLGVELKKNLLEQWWSSIKRSRTQVFGISTLTTGDEKSGEGNPSLDVERLNQLLDADEFNKAQRTQRILMLLRQSTSLRTNLLQGALEQYISWLELVNRRLPFGLAETGLSFQPDGSGSRAEATYASLVWFCSPRSSSQWLDHWARLRLQWWRKFALAPSEFSSRDVQVDELQEGASRGVKIVYSFPWGQETLENLWSLGDSDLLQTHGGVRAKIQCFDGQKLVVPHVISVVSNMDRSMMAYMHNSLQLMKKHDGKQKLYRRKVLKLHPVLAPVKVALDMGRGATLEQRQVCDGLLQEFLDAGISAWPGSIDITSSAEKLNTKYDEMGVLFTMVIDENTLESGVLQVRSRDTTIRESKHISEVKGFLLRYMRAAHNM